MGNYFPHDSDALNNLRLMLMTDKEGMKGYGIYWMTLEFLRQQTDYKASLKVLPILAQKARVTITTLKRIIYDYDLFQVDNTSFSSPGLCLRMKPLDSKREASKESGRRGGLANQQKIRDAKTSDASAINKSNENNNLSPTLSPQGETDGGNDEILLPPEYALNINTHNYNGLLEELKRNKVTDTKEINAILKLSDYGRIGGKVWKLLYEFVNTKLAARVQMPGKYIIKVLRSG